MKSTVDLNYHSQALNILRNSRAVTRHHLASEMGISLSLVNRVVNDLLEVDLLNEMGQMESSGGRPAGLLALKSQAGFVIGIDYGDKHQSAVVTDLSGNVVHRSFEKVIPTEKREAVVDSISDLMLRVTAAAGIPQHRILGLGIGVRDIVDASSGIVYGSSGQPDWGSVWADFPLRAALREKIPLPHLIVDDIVRALGTAEAVYSARVRGKDFLFVLADEGIGMAIMINGSPFTGFSHIAGEIGHIPVADAPMCSCGNYGCLCLHAATLPIVEKVNQRIREQPQWSILRQANTLVIDHIIQAANQGDKLAYQALTEAGEYLGKALAMVVNLLGPKHIIIGGKLSEADMYLQAAFRMIKIAALDRASRFVQVERSELDELAGPLGAATLALNAVFEPGERNLLQLAKRLHPVSLP